MVRNLRSSLGNVSVLRMGADVRTRIMATSDWVRSHVRINPDMLGEAEYGQFINDVLDYSDTSCHAPHGACGLKRCVTKMLLTIVFVSL